MTFVLTNSEFHNEIANPTVTSDCSLTNSEIVQPRISLYPNPVNNRLQIESDKNIKMVELFDVQGRLLQSIFFDNNQTELDFAEKNTGLYLVKIHTEYGVKVQKIIKE